MRLIHAGLGAGGRSLVTRDEELDLAVARVQLFRVPPGACSPPPGSAAALDLGVAPGAVSWLLRHLEPGYRYDMHHTDTIDLHVVLDGAAELVLDDGPHELRPGDAVAIAGVDHGWQVGPDGCTLAMLFVGTTPHQG